MDPYWILFENNIFAHLLFGPERRFAFASMLQFGGYDTVKMLIISVTGALSAFVFHYALGQGSLAILSQILGEGFTKRLVATRHKIRTYAYFALLFSYVPLFSPLLPLFAGFLRLNLLGSATLFCASIGGYYFYTLMA